MLRIWCDNGAMCVDLPALIERLRNMPKKQRDVIATAAGIGRSTTDKIAYGYIKDPSYSSVVKLTRALEAK
jgi:hypothetical protein